MPEKYVIHTHPVPNRFKPIARSGVIAWEEGCLRCAVCVKEKCVYDVYYKRGLDARYMTDSIDNLCMNCYRCVQGCPKELIQKSVNPEFTAMGDSFFTPAIIARLWYQAETGKIPVSGAGYPGPFCGPGFDSIWTDMSEIVRPTRDGIHGREYISTSVDLGRPSDFLLLDDAGNMVEEPPVLVDIPMPILLKVPPFGNINHTTFLGWATAAMKLGTMLACSLEQLSVLPRELHPWLIPLLDMDSLNPESIPKGVRIVELVKNDGWEDNLAKIKSTFSDLLVCIRIPMKQGMEKEALILANAGADIIHLQREEALTADEKASEEFGPRHVKEGIRSVHMALVDANIRNNVTLIASGGFAMAEHVPKALLCGADAVFSEFQLLIALQCRMCRRCVSGLSCPVDIGGASAKWVTARVINLFGAWHNQLLEVMGAMGIREARRLRGEVGRAMFYEDLDEATFGSLGSVGEGFELE
ncbi:MAG: glutamate synthase-related protein [Syntrophales bacterium]